MNTVISSWPAILIFLIWGAYKVSLYREDHLLTSEDRMRSDIRRIRNDINQLCFLVTALIVLVLWQGLPRPA